MPELRVLELQGGNFTKLAEVDLSALASLQTLQVGAGALSGATSLEFGAGCLAAVKHVDICCGWRGEGDEQT